jgi:hypothetical protein
LQHDPDWASSVLPEVLGELSQLLILSHNTPWVLQACYHIQWPYRSPLDHLLFLIVNLLHLCAQLALLIGYCLVIGIDTLCSTRLGTFPRL